SCTDRKVTLALLRRRALNTTDYKGPIVHNLGGPGADPLQLMPFDYGAGLHLELGHDHDLIAWDPRGGEQLFQCSSSLFDDLLTTTCQGIYRSRHPGVPGQYEDHAAFLNEYRRYHLIESASCEDLMGARGIQRYISTWHHAHDLHSIMEALGQSRIRFHGISWGTALGNYFATLFPDKVERMILNSNIDISLWTTGSLSSDFSDVEKILSRFFEECAGSSYCPIHEPTAEAVEARYENIMQLARFNSTHAELTANWLIEPPLYSTLIGMTHRMMYRPEYGFPGFAAALLAVEDSAVRMAATPESNLIAQEWTTRDDPDFDDNSYQDPHNPDHRYVFPNSGEEYTRCNDIVGGVSSNLDEMLENFEDASERHRAPGVELQFHWPCQGKPASKSPFTGPFGGKTSHPILYINTRLDPITPLVHAERNAKLFPGSGLVIAEGMGHTVYLGRNQCAMEHARQYLQDGTMPEFGTTCANELPILWPPPGNGESGPGTLENMARRDSKSEALDKASADWEEKMRRFAW
ncbi:Alpha/Beta hydrolase protein, partial [Plectosphaerella plurivora]